MSVRSESARAAPDLKALVRGIGAGERAVVARAITLIESKRPDHKQAARELVQELLPETGKGVRVGITGMPGVGKSTTIDALGTYLTEQGHRVAVLAVDPSSNRTGGSILADKTRMPRLAADPAAFIRPSPTSGSLGGVAAKTREAMLICEAAGFDAVLVETVGVGQSETAVADMTDFFLLLTIAGAGDELQGLKKGMADLWSRVLEHKEKLTASGELAQRRREQQVKWMWTMLDDRLFTRLKSDPALRARLPALEAAVAEGRLSPALAVDEIAQAMGL